MDENFQNNLRFSNTSVNQANRRENHSINLEDDKGGTSPEGLSWRRLHMSRAKLKASSTTSEILAGFALITMVELQINSPTQVPEWLFVVFAINTTVVVSLNIFGIMISTYLLPSIEASAKFGVLAESPHERMKTFIEIAWVLSNVLGLFLFLVQLAILCWVKFWDYSYDAALSAMVIIVPFLIVFIAFAVYFYHVQVGIKWKSSLMEVKELEDISHQLDYVV